MEILSTGEKIKRARVYQGITLKELCEDKISISKMSCIENSKIKADENILKYIADKLAVDYSYLVQDVHEEIVSNIELINKNSIAPNDIEEVINHNIYYALQYKYYNLAFELMHKLFQFYVEHKKVENIQLITSQYYDLYQKNNTEESTIHYYRDMATFFLSIREFNEAINYYNSIRKIIIDGGIKNKSVYAYISYNQSIAYEKVNMLDEAYEVLSEAIKYIDSIEDNMDKGEIYHSFSSLSIVLGKSDVDLYKELAYKYQKDNPMALAISKGKNGECYFYVGDNKKAIEEILDGIKIFPVHNEKKYVKFLNKCINSLYENKEYDKAYELIETAINMAINTEVNELMEEAYYLKGMILQKKGMYLQAEMYMNLSLDFTLKCGTKEKIYNRYLNMAELYYNLNEPKDSLKYFTLSMKLAGDF